MTTEKPKPRRVDLASEQKRRGGVTTMKKAGAIAPAVERALERLDPAWAKAAEALCGGLRRGHWPDQFMARSLLGVHEKLERRRERFKRGDSLELLHAVALCAEENVPMPTWLAQAYLAAFGAFVQPGGPASLDLTFHSKDLPSSTLKKSAAARQDWDEGVQLWLAVGRVAAEHSSLTSALNAVLRDGQSVQREDGTEVNRRWSLKATKARKLVELIDANQRELTSNPVKSLSQFWANRRKGAK